MKRALFLDRDGVLDELVYYPSHGEWESPRRISDLVLVDGVREPLQRFVDAGWLLFIVTNQPSFAKGKTSREELIVVHEAVVASLGVPIARSYLCFHHPDAIVDELRVKCECRKPGTKSLRDAASEFEVDLTRSWMVGDQDSDLKCGRAAGCKVALIESRGSSHKRGSVEPDLRVRDLTELARVILSEAKDLPGR
ncbi:MAG: HAD-IIIA family hydrolase [Acidobacteriota bacterium]|nr:HAD-IIIA family hydrolase [Acidobacteriota bacterium]